MSEDRRVVDTYRAASEIADERPRAETRAAILAAAARALQPLEGQRPARSRIAPSRKALALAASRTLVWGSASRPMARARRGSFSTEQTTMGTARVAGCAWSCDSSCQPSISGNMTSRTMICGDSAAALSSACSPRATSAMR